MAAHIDDPVPQYLRPRGHIKAGFRCGAARSPVLRAEDQRLRWACPAQSRRRSPPCACGVPLARRCRHQDRPKEGGWACPDGDPLGMEGACPARSRGAQSRRRSPPCACGVPLPRRCRHQDRPKEGGWARPDGDPLGMEGACPARSRGAQSRRRSPSGGWAWMRLGRLRSAPQVPAVPYRDKGMVPGFEARAPESGCDAGTR
jgi:hypothetical protein